ncbi:MAG: PatB family C-S lyase [Candidatus Marinimicrobia bacterium]|nr:PatB family C-S lyase [Candidatus Neomarinimicrobiota bacterium]
MLRKKINRYNTDCLKFDALEEVFGTKDIIPLWVADMDIPAPTVVRRALRQRLHHPVYGYYIHNKCFFESIIGWIKDQFSWEIEKEWITYTPGIVPAINIAVMSQTEKDDEVIIQTPVYPPFFNAVTDHNRKLITNPLKNENGRYSIDFDDLKSKISSKTKMLILCNPHNPVGRVYTWEELTELGNICRKNNIIIVSDEIHADVVYKPNKHIPIAGISKEFSDITITCMAPSKTFNIAGFATSEIIIENKEIRDKFRYTTSTLHICGSNILGDAALIAAYKHGKPWLKRTMRFLEKNIDFVVGYIRENIPSIHVSKPESTFLLWLDCREWGMSRKELTDFFINEAHLALSDGSMFGECGEGFMRMNIGTYRRTLKKALKQLQEAVDKSIDKG